MKSRLLNNFIVESNVSEKTIEDYKGKLPDQILDFWENYGFGTLLNGYLKVINPGSYDEVLKDTFLRSEGAIPIFTTAMGDVLYWSSLDDANKTYLGLLNYRKGTSSVITTKINLFFRFIEEEEKDFLEPDMDWLPYPEAVERDGPPAYDECFGYVPLLGLGGVEKVENLKKVKIVEHIYIIKELMGPIE
ncbi:T6SS immunity protein Tdi1 domain-containing protein [Alkalicoccobacillus murimartini]|uniref:DUF1851 domain-containing protein n=1 Tax=Alkalicoccobacillus murimartini TaxID=171685 RepID=A0ABT9YHA0_9BACI|nr:T6SS immunity protein Tdi1 domain-containing protein [Alkalicoccobacillus murimartini]MDQ0206983.1 hypothetical protein [Alkalicoccobacillus murimartini]